MIGLETNGLVKISLITALAISLLTQTSVNTGMIAKMENASSLAGLFCITRSV